MRLVVKYSGKDGNELSSAYESRPLKPISRVNRREKDGRLNEGARDKEVYRRTLKIFILLISWNGIARLYREIRELKCWSIFRRFLYICICECSFFVLFAGEIYVSNVVARVICKLSCNKLLFYNSRVDVRRVFC